MYRAGSDFAIPASPAPTQPAATSALAKLTMIRGPTRSTRYEVNGNNPVCAITKIVKAHETVDRLTPRSSFSGVVNCVHAYWRFAIATIAAMHAARTNHRDEL